MLNNVDLYIPTPQDKLSVPYFEVLLTVHLNIILVTDQLNAPILVL